MVLRMPLVVWASILWVAVAGAFGVILLYRFLITVKEHDQLFIGPAEMQRAADHRRDVNRVAAGFGIASLALLIAIILMWALGRP